MTVSQHVKDFLEANGVEFSHLEHDPAYTSQETAQAGHVPGREFAKTVILTDGQAFVMAVLPATRRIDLDAMKEAAGNPGLRLAKESEFEGVFPNCETGAMAPFGNLYDVPVFVDQSLRTDEMIAFNAGTHVDVIRMPYAAYEKLVAPVAADFSVPLQDR